jgi:hypothetical protein
METAKVAFVPAIIEILLRCIKALVTRKFESGPDRIRKLDARYRFAFKLNTFIRLNIMPWPIDFCITEITSVTCSSCIAASASILRANIKAFIRPFRNVFR